MKIIVKNVSEYRPYRRPVPVTDLPLEKVDIIKKFKPASSEFIGFPENAL